MDMFTDVDIFADILNAAMRKVAVYILLDEQNADHFVSMVSNCRVNLQTIQVSPFRQFYIFYIAHKFNCIVIFSLINIRTGCVYVAV